MRWTFEHDVDLGELGIRPAIILADVRVSWAREPEDGFDDVRVDIRSLEIYVPDYNKVKNEWDTRLVDFSSFLFGPGGDVIRQRIETQLEESHEQEILDAFQSVSTVNGSDDVA